MRKLFAAAVLLLLAGCQTPPPRYTIEAQPALPPPPPPAQHPQPVRPHPQVPNYAGTAGPLNAQGIGRYMDGMEIDLRRILRGTPVARPGDMLSLNLRDDALFEKDGSLSEEGRDTLKALAATLRHYDHTFVQVNGYSDTRGTPDQGLKFSQKRADAIAAELRADGVDAKRLSVAAFGPSHLKIATGPGKTEPRNRRIEIKIVPHPGGTT